MWVVVATASPPSEVFDDVIDDDVRLQIVVYPPPVEPVTEAVGGSLSTVVETPQFVPPGDVVLKAVLNST